MTSAGNEGILYHISWAPGDLGCIACCTSKNGFFIWSMEKGKVIKRIKDVSTQGLCSWLSCLILVVPAVWNCQHLQCSVSQAADNNIIKNNQNGTMQPQGNIQIMSKCTGNTVHYSPLYLLCSLLKQSHQMCALLHTPFVVKKCHQPCPQKWKKCNISSERVNVFISPKLSRARKVPLGE